jgi:hypothetical protein
MLAALGMDSYLEYLGYEEEFLIVLQIQLWYRLLSSRYLAHLAHSSRWHG